MVFVDNSYVLGSQLCLTLKERYDGLRVVVVGIGLVEGVERYHLCGSRDADITQQRCRKESLDNGLIALQELGDDFFGILVGVIFGLHLIVAVKDKGLQVERSLERAVADATGLHRLAAHLVVGEQHSVPGKHRVAL